MPWTVAWQAPLFMGFSRKRYWSGLLFPSPGDLPDTGIEPESPALQADSLQSYKESPHVGKYLKVSSNLQNSFNVSFCPKYLRFFIFLLYRMTQIFQKMTFIYLFEDKNKK